MESLKLSSLVKCKIVYFLGGEMSGFYTVYIEGL